MIPSPRQFTKRILLFLASATCTFGADTGHIEREVWTNLPYGSIHALESLPSFPHTPAYRETLGSFDTGVSSGERYGDRIRGFLHPPTTGSYTFWISGDDVADLYLSTDDNPSHKRKIARLDWHTGRHAWDNRSPQRSAEITLEADKIYYIEVLHAEATGGDHVAVAWQGPSLPRTVISGDHLSPSLGITAANDTYNTNASGALSVAPAAGVLANDETIGAAPQITVDTSQTIGAITPGQDGSFSYTPTSNFAGIDTFTYYLSTDDQTSNVATVRIAVNLGSGTISRQTWTGIAGSRITNLTAHPNYPATPQISGELASFSGPKNWASNHGTRLRGYIHPPETGDYTVWLTGDDNTELWISTDDNPANKTRVASVVGYTAPDQWNKYASQTASLNLQAGQRYYVELMHKEGGGADHYAVAWAGPNFEQSIISGAYLSPYSGLTCLNDQYCAPSAGAPITISAPEGVLANDNDNQTTALAVELVDAPTNGTINLAADGSFTYQPNADFIGFETFSYQATQEDATSNIATVTLACGLGSGTISRQIWTGISGGGIHQLTEAPDYPNTPKIEDERSTFETEINRRDAYGSRLRGYVHPPVDGDYTFWIASDDQSELWLSPTENPHEATKIAAANSWVPWRAFDKRGEQKSQPIALQAGKRYYIHALQKEGGGGDHLSVAWSTDQQERAIIDSPFLSPFNELVAMPDIYRIGQETTFNATTSVLANDNEGNLEGISAELVTPTTNGTVQLDPTGIFTYAPALGYVGFDAFTYRITNGTEHAFPVTVTLTVKLGSGGIRYQAWPNIPGVAVADLVNHESYPSTPNLDIILPTYEAARNRGSNYGSRTRGYIHAPITGTYQFAIASDDNGLLSLSTDDSFGNRRLIASVPGYTASRQWTRFPQQQSTTINLVAGEKYVVETFQKEGGGGDNLAVAWKIPEATEFAIIDGDYLSPFDDNLFADNDDYVSGYDTLLTVPADTGLLTNDNDGQHTNLTVELVDAPADGTLALAADGSFTYQPNPSRRGIDTFSYYVTDGVSISKPATVSITVGGLVAHWTLDDTIGQIAIDSASGNHGTLKGHPTDDTQWTVGHNSGALAFDGIDDHVTTPLAREFTTNFSWSCWLKTNQDGTILAKSDAAGAPSSAAKVLAIKNGNIQFETIGKGVSTGAPIADGKWHNVVLTAAFNVEGKKDRVRIYLDSALVAEKSDWDISLLDHGKSFCIGALPNQAAPFAGILDDVRVYNRVLSDLEIADLVDVEFAITAGLQSRTNPAYLEGTVPPTATHIDLALPDGPTHQAARLDAVRWFAIDHHALAGIPINQATTTPFTATMTTVDGSTETISDAATWIPTDIDGGTIVIRAGDALLLTFNGNYQGVPGQFEIDADGDGTYDFIGAPGDAFPWTYATPGTTTARVKADGIIVNELTIHALAIDFQGPTACEIGYTRTKAVTVEGASPDHVAWDGALIHVPTVATSGSTANLSLRTIAAGNACLAARAGGPEGAIIAWQPIDEFTITTSAANNRIVNTQTFADGSRLFSAVYTLMPVVPDLDVVLKAFVAGVTFGDSSIQQTHRSTDFDENGELTYYLIKGANVRTGVCHTRQVFQNGVSVSTKR